MEAIFKAIRLRMAAAMSMVSVRATLNPEVVNPYATSMHIISYLQGECHGLAPESAKDCTISIFWCPKNKNERKHGLTRKSLPDISTDPFYHDSPVINITQR